MFIEVHVKGGNVMMLGVHNIDFITPATNGGCKITGVLTGEEILVTEEYTEIRGMLNRASLLTGAVA